ncbi:MAG TPA: hypothetical protein VEI97_08740 [bacterium]|nr:hypothetical protein [bacterium]
MAIRPLDLARSIQAQALQAQERAGEHVQERIRQIRQDQHTRQEALQEMQRVQRQREAQRAVVDDRDPRPSHREPSQEPESPPPDPESAPLRIEAHANETPEGKGRVVDLDA